MKYTIKVEDVKEDLVLERTFWGQIRIMVKGVPPERSTEKGAPYLIPAKGGKKRKITIKPRFLDPCPQLFLDGQEVFYCRKLHRVEGIFAVLPVGMFLGHGLLAVLLGLAIIKLNFAILRTDIHATLKWVLIYLSGLSAYFLFSLLVRSLFY